MTHFNITASDDPCGSHCVLSPCVSDHSSKHSTPEPATHPHSIPSVKKAEAPRGLMTYLRLLTAWPGEPSLAPELIMLMAWSSPTLWSSPKGRWPDWRVFRTRGSKGEKPGKKPGYPWHRKQRTFKERGIPEEGIRILSHSSGGHSGGRGFFIALRKKPLRLCFRKFPSDYH